MKHYCGKLKKRLSKADLLKECTGCTPHSICNFGMTYNKQIEARQGTRKPNIDKDFGLYSEFFRV